MDTELKCNRLTCRKPLVDKAVVTTCSHIFCVECANELFNAARLCPACETSLSEPDDVVVCSLHPSNDYKTSVLSGLTPSIILEICSRAISFWQYQVHQENSFQQAVVRNYNDKNAQLQKQLENVVREANGEINILNKKTAELERDLELERRKIRDLQDASRERDKEYQKLKVQYDKIKRKALLAPNIASHDVPQGLNAALHHANEDQHGTARTFGANIGNTVDIGAVVDGMQANGIQRTPLPNRSAGIGNSYAPQSQHNNAWPQQVGHAPVQTHTRNRSHRQPFTAQADHSYHSGNVSDRSESANEVENMLIYGGSRRPGRVPMSHAGWQPAAAPAPKTRPAQRVFAPQPQTNNRVPGGFRHAR